MRRKTELIIATGLQMVAFAFVSWHALSGVLTDEAKYLLDIPYPHPPLIRFVMSMTDALPFQETFWRLILATAMVQAVWLVWDMTRESKHLEDRMVVCAGWLLSSAVLVQGGTILMAPIIALEALVFVWLMTKPATFAARNAALIALLWLATLFTAYQGILLLPLAWGALRHAGLDRRKILWCIVLPIGLLALYSFSNPFSLATMLIRGDQGVSMTLGKRLLGLGTLWVIGGAGLVSAVGTWGIIQSKDRALQGAFVLLCAFLFFSIAPAYYAILFTPLFVAGMKHLFHGRHHPHAYPLLAILVFASAVVTWFVQPEVTPTTARLVMQAIEARGHSGSVVINGSFGHEWQFESTLPVVRFRPEFTKDAQGVVCLQPCTGFNKIDWKLIPNVPAEAWIRR
jgi:hypothetical protein